MKEENLNERENANGDLGAIIKRFPTGVFEKGVPTDRDRYIRLRQSIEASRNKVLLVDEDFINKTFSRIIDPATNQVFASSIDQFKIFCDGLGFTVSQREDSRELAVTQKLY